MTKKHFEAIAALLANANLAVVDERGGADIVMRDLCDSMADYFDSENPRFDRDKFLTACGL